MERILRAQERLHEKSSLAAEEVERVEGNPWERAVAFWAPFVLFIGVEGHPGGKEGREEEEGQEERHHHGLYYAEHPF